MLSVRRAAVVLCGLAAFGSVGCSTMNNTERGALIGGGIGSVAGTLVGAATGNPRTGAVVGALGGATLGGLAGNAEDKQDRRVEQAVAADQIAQAQASRPEPLGLIGVVKMAQQGTNEDVIINHIRATGSTFTLSTADIEYLTANNVPPRVIQAMQMARPGYGAAPRPRTVVVREPAPVIIERPVYPVVYAPPPPPGIVFHGRFR